MTRPMAFAAPVFVGIIESAAAGAIEILVRGIERKLIARVGMDRRHEAAFDADRVVHHLGDGARQFVVHDAADTTMCSLRSLLSLTP